MSKPAAQFEPLAVAVLTVSDTRTPETDTSGDLLVQRLEGAGHTLAARQIVKDDVYQLRKVVSDWIADENIQIILTTGGTGFSGRDSTPEALSILFDKQIEGFGELFRQGLCRSTEHSAAWGPCKEVGHLDSRCRWVTCPRRSLHLRSGSD